MPLELLDAYNAAEIRDLTPLKGMPLTFLALSNAPVWDLSPLRGMPLKSRNIQGTAAAHLRPLAGIFSLPLEIG